jgi:hypothetical protein
LPGQKDVIDFGSRQVNIVAAIDLAIVTDADRVQVDYIFGGRTRFRRGGNVGKDWPQQVEPRLSRQFRTTAVKSSVADALAGATGRARQNARIKARRTVSVIAAHKFPTSLILPLRRCLQLTRTPARYGWPSPSRQVSRTGTSRVMPTRCGTSLP